MNTHLYDGSQKRVWVRELGSYGKYVGSDGRARTIAAFHVAQNRGELNASALRADMVRYLVGSTACRYWLKVGRLESTGEHARAFPLLQLTGEGFRECANSAGGGGNIPTAPAQIVKWIRTILTYEPHADGKWFDL